MKVLVFTGAGASVELGIPAMRQMAEQFREHLVDINLPPTVIEKIHSLINDKSKDMEDAIDVIDRLEGGFNARVEIGDVVNEEEIKPYRIIRHEAEWFVQHCCEQVKTSAAVRLWSPALRAQKDIDLTFATTNYDRAIEIAAARLKIHLNDGFEEFSGAESARWCGFDSSASLRLLKLHGSTNWYRSSNGEVVKLRHPMPLYGRLKIAPEEAANQTLQSALVLPSREKVTTTNPFPALAAEFRIDAKASDVAIFLGTSLRDPHMHDVFLTCAKNKPTFVVTRSKSFAEGFLPPEVIVISQSAGQFLISTLPEFLRTKNLDVLIHASKSPLNPEIDTLGWLVIACDENLSDRERCEAIENIANAQALLPHVEIETLLRSPATGVSLFSLGLIPISPSQKSLLEIARDLSKNGKDQDFMGELDTLVRMMSIAQ